MKALCIVAHPDDCIIFAWPLIDNFPTFEWTILYVTYDSKSDRGSEITDFWHRRNITTMMLGHNDTYLDMVNDKISFDTELAKEQILSLSKNYDLLLTHDHLGDYGHIHHKFVHDAVIRCNKPTIFFASQEHHTTTYVRKSKFDLSEIPLHKEVVEGFQNIEIGRYFIDDYARDILNVQTKA